MEPLFAHYLSLQKQKDLYDMDEREVKGRWKSFTGKWNRGELAEGWYDPEMFARIASEMKAQGWKERPAHQEDEDVAPLRREASTRYASEAEDEDDYGPALPSGSGRRAGAGIPSMNDISLRNELNEEERAAERQGLKDARKADRALQKERLDDVAPRAEAGTRERQLEKRQMVNDKMRSFRDRSPTGAIEADDKEMMGGGDSMEEYKRTKEQEKRRKTEREVRREEIERAKMEEMEERRRAWREREESTVSMLRDLARQRFGQQ